MIVSLLATLALGADNFDAHGFRMGTFNEDPATPLQMTLPGTWKKDSYAVAGLFEYAESPLIRIWSDGQVDRVLDNVVALNLAGGWAPHSRVRINASVPLYFASVGVDGGNGVDLGDLRLGGDALLLEGPLSLGVSPFLDLPTGASAESLGQGGVAGGGLLTGRLTQGRAAFGLGFGPYFRPKVVDLENIEGADRLLAGAHIGVRATDDLGINAELRAEMPFAKNAEVGTDNPVELLLHGNYRFTNGFHLLAGGAASLSQGASAANYRLFVGGGFARSPEPPPPVGAVAVEVTLGGEPVSDARVWITGTEPAELTSGLEPVVLGDRTPGDVYKGTAALGSCLAGLGRAMVPDGGTAPLVIELARIDAQVRVEVFDQDDQPLPNAIVSWSSDASRCVPDEPMVLRDTHTGTQAIGVGTHAVNVTAPEYSSYDETVELAEGDEKVIRVTLTRKRVVVKREKIEILEKVFFAFDGDQIDPKSGPLLDEVAAILVAHPEILEVEVGGHTDNYGEDQYNMDLSQRRVDSVRAWLIGKGVAEDRLVAKGYGESKPIADNGTDAGRAENRRVEFNILKRDESVEYEEVRTEPGDGAKAPAPPVDKEAPPPVDKEAAPPVDKEPAPTPADEAPAPPPVEKEAAPAEDEAPARPTVTKEPAPAPEAPEE